MASDRFSNAEIRKDAAQDAVVAATRAVGHVSTIIARAVGDVAKTVGGLATEVFEIRDQARKARADRSD